VHIVEEKNAIAEAGEDLFHVLPVELLPAAGGHAFQSLNHSRFITLSLQPADKPRAGV
jgi:hypothetical protein